MIVLKAPWEIAVMRSGGMRLAEVVEVLRGVIQAGMKTRDLDAIAEEEIRKRGAIPSFKGYKGGGKKAFPGTLCISLNHEVVHGIPDHRAFVQGDVVSVDLGCYYQGYHTDTAFTVTIGPVSRRVQSLLDATQESLYLAIARAQPGARLGDLGHAVESHVEPKGFRVIRDYVGHGIGKNLHEEPSVPNYGRPGTGVLLKPGMCIAIEPMVSLGTHETRVEANGWTVVTQDGSIAAHFEHTIAVTENGSKNLTCLEGTA